MHIHTLSYLIVLQDNTRTNAMCFTPATTTSLAWRQKFSCAPSLFQSRHQGRNRTHLKSGRPNLQWGAPGVYGELVKMMTAVER